MIASLYLRHSGKKSEPVFDKQFICIYSPLKILCSLEESTFFHRELQTCLGMGNYLLGRFLLMYTSFSFISRSLFIWPKNYVENLQLHVASKILPMFYLH